MSNYPHRFLLFDEVGLDKTIEAGMIKVHNTFAIYATKTVRYLKNMGVDGNPFRGQRRRHRVEVLDRGSAMARSSFVTSTGISSSLTKRTACGGGVPVKVSTRLVPATFDN